MREFNALFWLTLMNTIIGLIDSWPTCPPPNTIFPCDCNTTSGQFLCGKSISTNLVLKQIFQESSRLMRYDFRDKTIIFPKFVFENSIVDQLESDTFDVFAFNEILIVRNDYLKFIDENAFKSTYNITDKVIFELNPSIGSDINRVPKFFKVLTHFINATQIEVIECGLTFIPDNAFRPMIGVQTRLQRLSLTKNRIKTVGDFSFSTLPNLRFLSLHNNLIENLSKNSLSFNDSSVDLFLDLSKNQLKSSSFDSGALTSIKRPFDLQLSDNFITHLNETIFKNLFKKSIEIKLWRNPINCSDCRMKWTLNEKLCGISNNTISFSQRIEFQCKLFKENFRRCQNNSFLDSNENLEDILPCPQISSSNNNFKVNIFVILFIFLTFIV